MTQLDKIEKNLVFIVKQRDEDGCINYVMSYPITDLEYMVRVIRELVGYVTFLEGYCSKRMSAEKARKRFRLPPDVKELLK